MVDSNHRRHSQQIYSLSPLATREIPHINLCVSLAFPLATREIPHINLCVSLAFGAGRRTRTPDLLITNQLLYQLSYTSNLKSMGIISLIEPIVNSFFKNFSFFIFKPHRLL